MLNQCKFNYHIIFSASFYKINEEDQRIDEIEAYNKLNINHKITESDINNVDVKSQLGHQIQIQETKESGWKRDKNNSMKMRIQKTADLYGSSFVRIFLISNAILNIEKNDKYCFLWSILVSLHPCKNNHANRFLNYRQYVDELSIDGFDFSNGFKCSDVHKFEKLNNLSIGIFKLNFYQDGNNWKQNLIPIETGNIDSDRVVDLSIYKNNYALLKKLFAFLRDHKDIFICRRCLNSYR